MITLNDFIIKFSTRNANSYTTKEDIDLNFNFPKKYDLFDKFNDLYNNIKRFDNTLIFGARGVGKTLYLKKVKYDYLDENDSGIFPIYMDLTPIRDLFKSIENLKIDYLTQKEVFEYQLRFLVLSEIIKFYNEYDVNKKLKFVKIIGKKILSIVNDIFGMSQDEEDFEIYEELEKIKENLTNPFDFTKITSEGIVFNDSIKQLITEKDKFREILNKNFAEIIQIISNKSGITKFLILFDEFSMLTETLQNILAATIIRMSEEFNEPLQLKFKISVMEGRFLVNFDDYNFGEHGFGEYHFEKEFKEVFSGKGADSKLIIFYKQILKQRLNQSEDNIFEDFEAFRNLCYFAGFKIRDFLRFIYDICESNKRKQKITQQMVYDVCSTFYRRQLRLFQSKINQSLILDYLSQLSKVLKKTQNRFYFISSDFNKNFFQVMVYYKILSFVSYSRRNVSGGELLDSRGFLIDFSTALQFKIVKRSDLNNKDLQYLSFTNADTFIFEEISREKKEIALNLLKMGDLSHDQICQAVSIDEISLNKLKQQHDFNMDYNSEILIEQDDQVMEDEVFKQKVIEFIEIMYIGENLAIDLVKLGVNKKDFLKWKREDLNSFKTLVKQNYKGTLTRAFNIR